MNYYCGIVIYKWNVGYFWSLLRSSLVFLSALKFLTKGKSFATFPYCHIAYAWTIIQWIILLIFHLFISIRSGFLRFIYLKSNAWDCWQSYLRSGSSAFQFCIHASVVIEISIYSRPFEMATSCIKAAGISSSLTMTYLFFIFRAIAASILRITAHCRHRTQSKCTFRAQIYVCKCSGLTEVSGHLQCSTTLLKPLYFIMSHTTVKSDPMRQASVSHLRSNVLKCEVNLIWLIIPRNHCSRIQYLYKSWNVYTIAVINMVNWSVHKIINDYLIRFNAGTVWSKRFQRPIFDYFWQTNTNDNILN